MAIASHYGNRWPKDANNDFGLAKKILSSKLKELVSYEFDFQGERRTHLFQWNKGNSWRCTSCRKICLKKCGSRGTVSRIIVLNGRIITDPKFGHHPECEPSKVTDVISENLIREAKLKIREGQKRPLEAYRDASAKASSFGQITGDCEHIINVLPSYKKIRASLYRHAGLGKLKNAAKKGLCESTTISDSTTSKTLPANSTATHKRDNTSLIVKSPRQKSITREKKQLLFVPSKVLAKGTSINICGNCINFHLKETENVIPEVTSDDLCESTNISDPTTSDILTADSTVSNPLDTISSNSSANSKCQRLENIIREKKKIMGLPSIAVPKETNTNIYGQSISLQLKEMNICQRIFAQNIITELISYGKLGNLTENTTILLSK